MQAYPSQAHLVDALTVSANVIEVPARLEDHPPQRIVNEAVVAFADRLGRLHPGDVRVAGAGADVAVPRLHAPALLGADDRGQVAGLVGRVPGLRGTRPEVVDGYVNWLYGRYLSVAPGGGVEWGGDVAAGPAR